MRKILVAVFVLVSFVVGLPAWAAWPIKDFKVLARPPTSIPPPGVETLSGVPIPGTAAAILAHDIEDFLSEFPGPHEDGVIA